MNKNTRLVAMAREVIDDHRRKYHKGYATLADTTEALADALEARTGVPIVQDRISPLRLGLSLIRMHFQGWRSIPGYTVTQTEQDGTRYVSMWLDRSR